MSKYDLILKKPTEYNSHSLFGVIASGKQSAPVGGWKELTRTTLGGTNTLVTASSIANKRYFMVLENLFGTAAIRPRWRSGNGSLDTGSNYASRNSDDGTADVTLINQSNIPYNTLTQSTPFFHVSYIANLSAQEKLMLGHSVNQNTAAAGNPPTREEVVGKHVFTSNPLDQIASFTSDSTFAANSEIVVLGWDPADVHTDNFWEELASVTLGTAANEFSTGTFTAKKYLWVQIYNAGLSLSRTLRLFMNGSQASIYAYRSSEDGATDTTNTGESNIEISQPPEIVPTFTNLFIINNSANEKLVTGNTVIQNIAGAGNPPSRYEFAGKQVNTSSQITELTITLATGNINAGALIKVWGSN